MVKKDFKLVKFLIHKKDANNNITKELNDIGLFVTNNGKIKVTEDNFQQLFRDAFGTSDGGTTRVNMENAKISTLANEFVQSLTNLVVVQRFYASLANYTNPLSMFMIDGGPFGDNEQGVTINVQDEADYNSSATPYPTGKEPITYSFEIKTKEKKVWTVTMSSEIVSAAMLGSSELGSFASGVFAQLQAKRQLYLFRLAQRDLKSSITKTQTIVKVDDAGQVNQIRKAWEQIIKLIDDMSLPSKNYINATVPAGDPLFNTFTPLGTAVLLLTTRYASSLQSNVMASVFNSSKIAPNLITSKVVLIEDDPSDPNLIGYVMDKDAYLMNYRINKGMSKVNEANITISYFFHQWLRTGFNPYLNAVKLVASTTSKTRTDIPERQFQVLHGIADGSQPTFNDKTLNTDDLYKDGVASVQPLTGVFGEYKFYRPLEAVPYKTFDTQNGNYMVKGTWYWANHTSTTLISDKTSATNAFRDVLKGTNTTTWFNKDKGVKEFSFMVQNGEVVDMSNTDITYVNTGGVTKLTKLRFVIENGKLIPEVWDSNNSGEDGVFSVINFEVFDI